MKTGTCKHCGATVVHTPGTTVGWAPWTSDPSWRNEAVDTGKAWCSRKGGDGPPHQVDEVTIPDLSSPTDVARWLDD